ncbi:hypothetical protein MFLAVUS_008002 [Mucor flavus]|uniref:Uncharacterized protein n=1 Tax=Mucor flavus TaxID=439312 RepID=A0ABP9Z5V9_9FUNG
MPTQKLTLEQQQQLLHAACLAVLNSPDTVYPIRFDPFEHFVSKVIKFLNNLVYFLLALALIWFSSFISFKSFILLVISLGLVNLYSFHGKYAIRNVAHWYWYKYTDNHKGGHESNCVPSPIDNSRYCSTLGVEDDAGLFFDPECDGCCYCSSLEGEDAGSHYSEANGYCYCSTLGEKDNAGAIESNTRCYCSSLEGEDAGGIARGDDVIVEGDSTHLPGDIDLGDGHGANDINLVVGEIGSVSINLVVHNVEISGNINPAFLENKLLSPPIEKMGYDIVSVSYPFVELLEKECGDSNTPFSYIKNSTKVQDSVRHSRLRVRRFTRSRPGVPRCTRLRPLRFAGGSSFRCSSSLVEYMEIDSCDKLEEMASFCEPMDIDSFEEISAGDEQQLVVGNFGSFSFGYVPNLKEGSFEPVATGAGSPVCTIPFLTPSFGVSLPPSSNGIFLKEPVPSDFCLPVTDIKFETSVSDERELVSIPELVAQEDIAKTKVEQVSSLVEAIICSPIRPLVTKVPSCLKSKAGVPTGSSTTVTTTTTTRPLVEDPFDSKPLNRMAFTSSSSAPTTTSKKSFLNSLFDDAEEEEEEEIKKEEEKKEAKKPMKKDGRKVAQPKARIRR